MPRDARRDVFADAKAILRCRAVILYSPLTLAKRISLAVRQISLRSNITRRKANITEKALANASAFSWLPLLGLVGVCKAAATEFAFGGYTPPISLCETGKLFQACRTRSQRKNHPNRVVFFFGSPCWARTNDIVINSHALYRLS